MIQRPRLLYSTLLAVFTLFSRRICLSKRRDCAQQMLARLCKDCYTFGLVHLSALLRMHRRNDEAPGTVRDHGMTKAPMQCEEQGRLKKKPLHGVCVAERSSKAFVA
ncbi:hypothetical protein BKA81DRAFT_63919 [Phyllosticta paracitricarpa]